LLNDFFGSKSTLFSFLLQKLTKKQNVSTKPVTHAIPFIKMEPMDGKSPVELKILNKHYTLLHLWLMP
jgi:hypothetical protein